MKYLFLALLLFFTPAIAQEAQPTRHPSVQVELDKKQAEAKKAELEKQSKSIEGALDDTQDALVNIAAKIKKNETRLNDLEKKMGEDRKEQDEIQARRN